MNRQSLTKALQSYNAATEIEKSFIPQFLDLLLHPDAFLRTHLPGHITGSAWIIDTTKNHALLTHHAKLNKWLQPGGHADGDENVINVARREAEEETGLKQIVLLQDQIFDIDIHSIPARKEFPQHLHFDIRFLFQASMDEELSLTDESHALEWVHVDHLVRLTDNNSSLLRMADKVRLLGTDQQ